ncbi:hypothetical protein [Urbifossiella limnaea]|uniref:DUF4013 domain-containing protein n=1 Tax=Urbifossiella limnaea TaxID=2528023 RepID=A0A517XXN0_9BACT|nr:hypothetical protein [Urbifossiella limnaea]QDU22223.1 hypothetical protein ETAA1_42000 [Urbifossiella limnaea]
MTRVAALKPIPLHREVFDAELDVFDAAVAPEPPNPLGVVGRVAEWLFGAATLTLGLALLTAVPLGQVLVLGYLLEVTGRVARTGRLRDGLIGVRTAARLGGAALGAGVLWVPLYVVSGIAESARIIDPAGTPVRLWEGLLLALMAVYVLHVAGALVRGGRLRHFLHPLNIPWLGLKLMRGSLYSDCRDRLWGSLVRLRLRHYFSLGVRGYLGAFLWLVVPLALLGSGHRLPLLGILGAGLLGIVVLYLPQLQARFARDNQLRAYREWLSVRRDFGRAPLAFAFAVWVQLLAASPLYLLKIEAIPRDLIFLEGFVFLAFMFPARLVTGWAYARAGRRDEPRHFVFRWLGRLVVLPVVVAYVGVVFTSQHIGWHGVSSLYEQHAFLLPVPFTDVDAK